MRDLFDWWLRQLAGLLPNRWAQTGTKPTDALILELDGQHLHVVIRANGMRTCMADARTDDAGIRELARSIARETNLPRTVVLRLSASQVLHKHVTLPVAARHDLDQVLGFEIDRETPFTRDEVHWTYSVRSIPSGSAKLDIDLHLVPRSFVDPFLDRLKSAGIEPQGVEVDAGGDATTLISFGPPKRGPWLHIERPLLPLATAAAVLAMLAMATPLLIQQWVQFSADAVMGSLTGAAHEAATLRQTVDSAARGADFLKEERHRNPSIVAILAAVTDSLPDDTYLTSLSIKNGRITMTGLSASAADLIGGLANTAGLSGPAFDAPVIQNEDNNLESFTISATLTQVGAV
jgi:general secretion pathway protein L